jgi:hypothetical protein
LRPASCCSARRAGCSARPHESDRPLEWQGVNVRFGAVIPAPSLAGIGRAETTTLADGMPLGIRPFSKSKLDELWGCGKLARGASDRCSVGTAASY